MTSRDGNVYLRARPSRMRCSSALSVTTRGFDLGMVCLLWERNDPSLQDGKYGRVFMRTGTKRFPRQRESGDGGHAVALQLPTSGDAPADSGGLGLVAEDLRRASP